ncbi:MAG: ABC transporter substrate-binding protein [Candidatus Kapaibacterium sp.]
MSSEILSNAISRRSLLKGLGMLSGAVATASAIPMVSSKAFASDAVRMLSAHGTLKLGVLLPDSCFSPSPGTSMMNGIDLYLNGLDGRIAGRKVKVVAENIGSGINGAVRGSRKLVEEQGADIVIGMINSRTTPLIRDIYEKNGAVLIETNIGERIADDRSKSDHIFRNTLDNTAANYALGRWAAQNLGRRGMIAGSFYESGFDTIAAFRAGFTSAGGTIVDEQISCSPATMKHISCVVASIGERRPDFVYALYSGHPAVSFIEAYGRKGKHAGVPLIGSGFLTEERLLVDAGADANGIRSALPWSAALQTAENQEFTERYRAKMGQLPNAFALLGYDSARIVAEALTALDGDTGRPSEIIDALRRVKFDSPRGPLTIASGTQSVITPLYLREVRTVNGTQVNQVIGTLSLPTDVSMIVPGGNNSGWLTPYHTV